MEIFFNPMMKLRLHFFDEGALAVQAERFYTHIYLSFHLSPAPSRR